MTSLPCYSLIIDRIKQGASILDVGCCFGQDLRFLAADGAPTGEMYATDIVPDFWHLGYDLFRDKARFNARFIAADILAAHSSLLQELEGRVDISLVNQVFHLFSREKQVTMAKNLVRMSTAPGWIVGWHVGSQEGRALPVSTQTGGSDGSAGSETKLFHNDRTWRELWQEIGQETGTQWEVQTWMQPLNEWGYEKEDTAWMGPGAMGFEFICRRVGGLTRHEPKRPNPS